MLELIIKIPEEYYKAITEIPNHQCTADMLIIKNGISLPKDHGRLIDADAINIHDVSPAYGMEVYGVTQDDIEYEPTIIEADKGSEK